MSPGVDITPKLRQHKVHSVLFLNVPCFGSGTRPWNSAHGTQRLDDGECVVSCAGDSTPHVLLPCAGDSTPHHIFPCHVSGLIEVVGLTTYQLPLLQAGGTGHCITQCRVGTRSHTWPHTQRSHT